MNIQQLASWLQKPQTLNMHSIQELEALVEEYPYFNAARILLARAAKNEEDHHFHKFLKAAALYAGDRKKLFHYLETDAAELEAALKIKASETVQASSPVEKKETEILEEVSSIEPEETDVENTALETPETTDINSIAREEQSPAEPENEPSDFREYEEEEAEEPGIKAEEVPESNIPLSKTSIPERDEKEANEFVLKNLDDWDDIVYEEHSKHIPDAGIKLRSSDDSFFKRREEEIKEETQDAGEMSHIPPDESVDSEYSRAEEDTKPAYEPVSDEGTSGQIIDKEEETEELNEDSALWENESFPEEVALSSTTELDEKPVREEMSVNPEPGGKYRFEEWLSALQMLSRIEKKEAEEKKQEEEHKLTETKKPAPEQSTAPLTEEQEADPKAGSRDIIENFLKVEPSISKPHAEFYKPKNMAKQSEQFHEDEWATETLASIYAKQGHAERAIRIYEKLILQMPDKKAYFASLIEELNKKR